MADTAALTLPRFALDANNSTGTSSTSADLYISLPVVDGAGMSGTLSTATVTMPALTINAHNYDSVNVALPLLQADGVGVGGTATPLPAPSIELPKLTISAQGLTPSDATASLSLPMLRVDAHSDSYASLRLSALQVVANGVGGQSAQLSASFPALLVGGTGEVENLAHASLQAPVFVLLATGNGGSAGALDKALAKLSISAAGEAGGTGTINGTLPSLSLTATGISEVIGSASISLPMLQLLANGHSSVSAVYDTYCMNTNTSGLTNYSDYGFNSMTMFNGVALAANDNGIYALSGALDDTVNITSHIKLGIFDFDNAQLKRVDVLYFAYRANGDLTVRVTLDDNEQYEYTLESTGQDGIYTNRLKMGKGMKARYWQLEVEGDGTNFVLDSISMQPEALARRL